MISDRYGIGKVYCESWKAAYRDLLPQSYLDGLTPENCMPDAVSEEDIVWEEQGNICGICHIQPARSRDSEVWGELVSLYLLPEKWGCGCGSQLLQSALCKLKKRGFENVCLWVLKDNGRARRFYEKHGFAVSGKERQIEAAGCSVCEVEYIYHGRERKRETAK